MKTTPTIDSVTAIPRLKHLALVMDGERVVIDVSGWIATGGDVLAPLKDDKMFETARVAGYGSAVQWGEDGGDLAIDSTHLAMLGREQAMFSLEELIGWQADARLSNAEACQVLGVSSSTWARYKTGDQIPEAVAIAIRAARRDPIILQARLRPTTRGRPRTASAG